MNYKISLLAISLSSLSFLSFNANPKKFSTEFAILGPFEEYADDCNLSGMITPLVSVPGAKERLSVAVSGASYSKFITTQAHDAYKNQLFFLTFKLPLKTMLSYKGIDCLVEFLDNEYNTLQSFTFSLKPMRKISINPGDYLTSYCSIKDTIVDPDNYKSTSGEELMFNGFIDYFNINNYYRLSLDGLYLTHKCLKDDFSIQAEAYLHFDDYNAVFPTLDMSTDIPCFDIPLLAVKSRNKVSFKLKNTMYVNPKTLEMSLNAKPNYVPTHYFYLPINKMSDLFNQKFTLKVDSFGFNKISFSWDLRYTNNHGLIGDCHNADYCVRGEA